MANGACVQYDPCRPILVGSAFSRAAAVATQRLFDGPSIEEVAEAMGVPLATVFRERTFAILAGHRPGLGTPTGRRVAARACLEAIARSFRVAAIRRGIEVQVRLCYRTAG